VIVEALGTKSSFTMPTADGKTGHGKIHQYFGYLFAALVIGGGVLSPLGFYIFATFIK